MRLPQPLLPIPDLEIDPVALAVAAGVEDVDGVEGPELAESCERHQHKQEAEAAPPRPARCIPDCACAIHRAHLSIAQCGGFPIA